LEHVVFNSNLICHFINFHDIGVLKIQICNFFSITTYLAAKNNYILFAKQNPIGLPAIQIHTNKDNQEIYMYIQLVITSLKFGHISSN
jgi:hypothetical protein